jgi:hypothetical protein
MARSGFETRSRLGGTASQGVGDFGVRGVIGGDTLICILGMVALR